MSDKPDVLIAGAGIGGLTAALALIHQGFNVKLYEQARKSARSVLGGADIPQRDAGSSDLACR
jgi:salicylate hydroxylase